MFAFWAVDPTTAPNFKPDFWLPVHLAEKKFLAHYELEACFYNYAKFRLNPAHRSECLLLRP